MSFQFKKATKQQARLRLALVGPSGSGKTYSALAIGKHLGNRVAVIDTERGSASKYADIFDFDALELATFSPLTYVEAIHAAEQAGYDVLIIDSLSHAWMGKEGALEQVDKAARRYQNNSYAGWRDVTPMHNALIDAMLQSPCHIIVTMRAKTDYVLEKDERTGKTIPRKIGLAPVQRDGMEYEFDVVADMDQDNNMIVSKSRCPAMSGTVVNKPGQQVAEALKDWLSDGVPVKNPTPPPDREDEIPTELGYEVAPEPAQPKISLETAENITNSKGTRYGDLDSETLIRMSRSISKKLRENHLAPEQRDEIKLKLDAIAVILQARAQAQPN